jgi:outer membrane usher protein FimD/PapC
MDERLPFAKRRRLPTALALALAMLCIGARAATGPGAPADNDSTASSGASPADSADGATTAAGGSAAGAAANFDPELLRLRGFDPNLAEYLKRASRYTPGDHEVALLVNGIRRGKHLARFDADGQLCIDASIIEAARLKMPPPALEACLHLESVYAKAEVDARSEVGEVALVVPEHALLEAEHASTHFSRGGVGGLFNYEVVGSRSTSGTQHSQHAIANTEIGLNAGDWIFRSAQSYSDANGASRFQRRHTYAQHTLLQARALLQVGDVTLENAVLPGALITGVQVLPEAQLSRVVNGSVDGIAHSNARVDVRQSGTLIYSTIVPPGPFSLAGLPLLDAISSLDVTVTESDNSEHRFTLPAATLAAGVVAQPTGYALSVGRLRETGSASADDEQPWLLSASGTWPWKKRGTLSNGALVARDYGAVGVGGALAFAGTNALSSQLMASHARKEGVRGAQLNVSLQLQVTGHTGIHASLLERTSGYRDLVDTVGASGTTRNLAQSGYSLGGFWSDARFGALGLSCARSSSPGRMEDTRITSNWSKRFGRVSVSATAEWGLSDASRARDTIYVSARIPLGSNDRVLTATARRLDTHDRYGVTVDDRLGDLLRYRAGVERDTRYRAIQYRVDASLLPRYAQLDFGYAHGPSGDSTSTYALRGGVALHGTGATFSPYPIRDSFAIVSVGRVPGVKLQTPSGPVWTDWRGKAVVSQLNAYAVSAIRLLPASLPRNVHVDNDLQEIEASRGAVQHLDYGVGIARRVLLRARFPDGRPIPAGASVLDRQQRLVTLSTEGGEIFLIKDPAQDGIELRMPEGDACALDFTLPKHARVDAHYETLEAVCRPMPLDERPGEQDG